ncbi:unnamed protein product, partial [Didymodactylos carnosus]
LKRVCAVCFKSKMMNKYQQKFSSNCSHIERTVCDRCLYDNIKAILLSNNSHINSTEIVKCPEPDCSTIFDYRSIKQILISKQDFELCEQYEKELVEHKIETLKGHIYCAHSKCGAAQQKTETGNIVTCFKCKKKTCSYHRVPWHQGMTCREYDEETRDDGHHKLRKWLEKNSKECPGPGCHYHIEKNDGCDHMTCLKCKHEFCYVCLADWKRIVSEGEKYHKMDCPYYNDETNED